VIKPDNDERQQALFKDNKLRLLLSLVGCIRLGAHDDPEATWVIPAALTSAQLQVSIDLIHKFEFDPPTYEDGQNPEDLLRRKTAPRKSARRVDWDDSDNDVIDDDDVEDLGEYGPDGPTSREADGTRKVLKRRRRARSPVELNDEEREERARARREREIEKQMKVKSTMFVHDSDDEDDAERDAIFFAAEESRRLRAAAEGASMMLAGAGHGGGKKRKAEGGGRNGVKKRKSPMRKKRGPFDSSDEDEDDDGDEEMDEDESVSSRALSEKRDGEDEDSEEEVEGTDTPLSSQPRTSTEKANVSQAVTVDSDEVMADASDEEDGPVPARKPAARNMRGGFVIDSDSEDE